MKLHLLSLQQVPIFQQLQIEEALIRTEEKNFCLINYGSPPAIVMGISGEPETLIHLEQARSDSIPIIKRFSGGGTVIVDENTLFFTFIIQKRDLPIPPFPEPILRWTADLYGKSWKIPGFHLRENDYCIGEKKCGGNAQYIRKDCWLHHTSFLYDYSPQKMEYLKLPPKRPKYRADRPHTDFLCRLKEYGTKEELIEKLQTELVKQFYIEPFEWKEGEEKPHRKATELVE